MAAMRRLDRLRAINFVDVASFGSVCPLNRDALFARLHACEDGVMLSGAAAFAAIWRTVRRLSPPSLATRRSSRFALLDRGYSLFLRRWPRRWRIAARGLSA